MPAQPTVVVVPLCRYHSRELPDAGRIRNRSSFDGRPRHDLCDVGPGSIHVARAW